MGLETATYISQLVATNPLGTDPKSQGDNHLQLIKSVLQNQFPNFTAAAVTLTVAQLNDVINKAGLNSPNFTGIPTAPTAVIGTNTTQLATTAFVLNSVATGTTPATAGDAGKFWYWDGAAYSWQYAAEKIQRTITGADTAIVSDRQKILHFSSASNATLTLTAAATLGNGWFCLIRNGGNTDWTLDPSGAELVAGQSTLVVKPGFTGWLRCDGTAFDVLWIKRRTYGAPALVTSSGTYTVPADTYVIREYACGAGSAGTVANGGAGGGMAYGDIAVTPGQTVTRTISAGVATVTVGGVVMLTGNPASGTTAGTASKHSSVTNGGAFSGGAGAANAGGGSSGSPLGTGVAGVASSGGSGWGGAGGTAGGGGTGGAASTYAGGVSLSESFPSTEPLLALMSGSPGSFGAGLNGTGGRGGKGAGGGSGSPGTGAGGSAGPGGKGGDGSGGGATGTGVPSSLPAGDGGLGGGGGASVTPSSGAAGAGGLGGGGGFGSTPGAGGAAFIVYFTGNLA